MASFPESLFLFGFYSHYIFFCLLRKEKFQGGGIEFAGFD
jgi:hypothetical protein